MNKVTNKFEGKITPNYPEDEPNIVGITLLGGRDDEVCLSGELEWESLKLEVNVTCENNESSVFENMNILRDFVDEFEKCETDIDGLSIEWAEHLGSKVRPPYMNGYGLQVCKCIIDFGYNIIN